MKTTLLILSFLLLQGCSNNDDSFTPTLPPITQTGANTLGCYIDGKLLTPRDGTGTLHTQDRGMRFWRSPNEFEYNELAVRDFKTGTGGIIDIHIHNLHAIGEGSYVINESNCEDGIDANPSINIRCRWLDEETQTYKWYCSFEKGGYLTITRYDPDNFIVSGTFHCTVQNREDSKDIIEITEGRFDINRSTLEYTNFH